MRRVSQVMVIGAMMSTCIVSPVHSDTVVLKNGDRVTGKECSVKAGKVTIKTEYAEKVELDLAGVEKITFDEPAKVILSDGIEKEVTELSLSEIEPDAIAAVNPPPPKVWSLDISAGYSLNSGNSNTQDVNLQVTAVRTINDLLRFTGYGGYFWGKAEDEDTGEDEIVTERGAASLQADLFLIEDGYTYGRTEISYDKMKDLDRRIDNGIGVGYQILTREYASVDLEAGGAYIDSKYEDGSKDHGVFLRFAGSGQLQINERLSFVQDLEYKPKVKNFNDYLLNASAGLRVSLTANLYFQVSVIDRYDNNPAEDKKRNDVSVIGSLGVAL